MTNTGVCICIFIIEKKVSQSSQVKPKDITLHRRKDALVCSGRLGGVLAERWRRAEACEASGLPAACADAG